MRTATAVFPRLRLRRSALIVLTILGAACDDASSPLEPPASPQLSEQGAIARPVEPAAGGGADNSAYTGTYTPAAGWS